MNSKTISSYGVAGYATMFTFAAYASYGLYFYTDVVGFPSIIASIILMVGTLWDAITDPIIGHWSDNRIDKKGKRRPVIFATIIPFGIVSWLLFTDFHFSQIYDIIYFVIMTMAFFTLQTFLDISYTSMSAEITTDYNERIKLSGSRGIWGCIAMIATSFILISCNSIGNYFQSDRVGWSITFGIFAILSSLSILFTWRKTDGIEHPTTEKSCEKLSYKDIINGPFKNKPFLCVMTMFTMGIISQTIFASFNTYYCYNNLLLNDKQLTIAMLIVWCGGLPALKIIDSISTKLGKKYSWLVCVGIMSMSFVLFPGFLLQPNNHITVYLYCFLISAGFQAFYIVPWSMIPDTIEVDEFKTGKRHEGLYYGIISCAQKVGSAIAFVFSGFYLDIIGYDALEVVQSSTTLSGIKWIYVAGTAIPLIISLIFAWINPMTKELHDKYLRIINKRKNKYKMEMYYE